MHKKINVIHFIALCCLLAGCGVNRGQYLNPNTVSMIQRNSTTEGQIRQMFGEPVQVRIDPQRGVKILTYRYQNDDELKKMAATLGGTIVGGVIGHQFGGGSGKDLATSAGALTGGVLGENAVQTRREAQTLDVVISLRTGQVVDYRYLESRDRTQGWQLNRGVAPL